MNIERILHNSWKRRALVSIGLFSFFLFQVCLAADPQNDENAAPEEAVPIEIEKSTTDFEYQVDDRPDPFAPFVTGPAQTNPVTPDEIIEENEVLTGMQLFEPGQLTLVALMLTGGNAVAMVQDFTGRGYLIEEGMKIGRRGVITRITEDKVLIEETSRTRSGKVLKNEIAMVLKREGEE
ncbi:MAG: pilus assembly protein PilP [Desulfofustis sp.]|jgi:type IV pilus assembly protein PilP